MKFPFSTSLIIFVVVLGTNTFAQKARHRSAHKTQIRSDKITAEIGQTAIVIDETLSVLRMTPSLFSDSVQRMRRGRKVQILGVAEADGVKFYKVAAPPSSFGWVQADAVFGKFRTGDEERFAQLVTGYGWISTRSRRRSNF